MPIKRDQRAGVDRRGTEGTKRVVHVPEKEVARTIFRENLPLSDCMYVFARVREFEQLNHWNFISVRRPGNITVRSVVAARDFGSGAALAPSEFLPFPATNHS